MTPKFIFGAAAALALALAAGFAGWALGTEQAKPATPPAIAARPVTVVDGVTLVQVDAAMQQRSGILVEPARAAGQAAQATHLVAGTVMDLQPLLDWRGRLAAAGAQVLAAQAQWQASKEELRRTEALHADDRNASQRALEAARSAEARDHAQQQSAEASLASLREQGLQQFGPALTAWAGASGRLDALIARRDAIAAFATGDDPPRRIAVETAAGQAQGEWIAPSPTADPRLGTGMQLYRVPGPLPLNANLVGHTPRGDATAGVLVPLAAVVWHAGQPWAYVRRDAQRFARVWLRQAIETRDGFVVPGTIQPGEPLVTQGAQLLLSQEQLPPPGAGGCKDPECD